MWRELKCAASAKRPQSLASLGGHGLTPKEMDDDCWPVRAASFLPESGGVGVAQAGLGKWTHGGGNPVVTSPALHAIAPEFIGRHTPVRFLSFLSPAPFSGFDQPHRARNTQQSPPSAGFVVSAGLRIGVHTAKSSTQPCKANTWCVPSLARPQVRNAA